MAWSGGSFARVISGGWATDKATTPKITAARHDTNDDDLATGINACITKDGNNAFTGDIDAGTHDLTNVGSIDAAGTLGFKLSGVTKWTIASSGAALLPDADDTYNIGSTSAGVQVVHANTLLASTGHKLIVASPTGKVIDFQVGGASKWYTDVNGDIIPSNTGVLDLGAATKAFVDIWGSSFKSPAHLLITPAVGSDIKFQAGGVTTFELIGSNGHLYPATSGTHDIGALSKQLRTVYTGNLNLNSTIGLSKTSTTSYLQIGVGSSTYYLHLYT